MKDDVCIIIPVFNEAARVGKVIREVKKHFKHVVCIDDGSIDGSGEVIEQSGAMRLHHPINLGQGAALQTGIEFALLNKNIQYFVTYDADGQHSLADVIAMLDYIRAHDDTDIVLGSRFLGATENMSNAKRKTLRLAVAFSNMTTGLKLTDTHNGLRVFNRRVASELDITMPDFAHASEIIHRIAEKKFRYHEMPVTITYSDYSRAKGQSIINAVNIAFDLLLHRAVKK